MTQLRVRLWRLIIVATLSKFLMNVARRMVYPFAPAFARGLGVDLTAVTSIIALNQATAVLGPLGASFADRYGGRQIMLTALAMTGLGCVALGLFPHYGLLVACLFFSGLAKSLFDPSLQAFIGSQVPYGSRGKYIGATELSWALATLAGIPLAGVLIEHFSWQTPFLGIGALSIICLVFIARYMPGRYGGGGLKTGPTAIPWRTILKNPRVIGYVGFAFFTSMANDALFVVYGAWLEKSCNLTLTAIGFGTMFIGLAEMLAEGGTALFSDRIGLSRAAIGGTALCTLSYMILPFADGSLPLILAALFSLFFCFEFTMVTSMGLGTELLPEYRASLMAGFYALGGIGRVIGALSGGLIWSAWGIKGVSLFSALVSAAALAALAIGFTRKSTSPTPPA